jgi:digeranylgeranylglycerophospholipid reductase
VEYIITLVLQIKLKLGIENNYTGYYWIFPKSRTEANVGVGYLEKSKLSLWDELDRVLEKEGLSSCKVVKRIGGLCPVAKLDMLVYGNVLLTGDAAGLTSPIHGGGIDTACISGKIAIQSILNNNVDSYEGEINRVLNKKLKGELGLRELWKAFIFEEVDYIIKVIHDAGIKLGDCGFFTGEIHILEKMGYVKYLLSPGRKNFYLSMAKRFLSERIVHQIFTYLLT